MIRHAVALVGLLAACCIPALPALYQGELEACVDTARTLEESEACRCEVNKRYGRECTPAIRENDAGL